MLYRAFPVNKQPAVKACKSMALNWNASFIISDLEEGVWSVEFSNRGEVLDIN
jgi:hypothetical protein